jgi:NAD(P)-dependent dehydrogenase (short-subunit alcohol dehydrogenase family)
MGHIDFDDLQSTRKYRMFAAYGRSKLACVMATYDLAERWQALGITVNCLHPGVIDTNLGGMPGFVKKLLPKADKGARTSLYLAMSPEVADVTGRYFSNCKVAKSSAESHDRAVRARLWQETERLVGLA